MAPYLVDTNLLVRVADGDSATHLLAIEAIEKLLKQQHKVYITGQNLVEFWAVATRPLEANGLGWTTQQTEAVITQFLSAFVFWIIRLLSSQIGGHSLQLTTSKVRERMMPA